MTLGLASLFVFWVVTVVVSLIVGVDALKKSYRHIQAIRKFNRGRRHV